MTSWALTDDAELVWCKFEASAVRSELCSTLTLEHETPWKENKLKQKGVMRLGGFLLIVVLNKTWHVGQSTRCSKSTESDDKKHG